MTEHCLPKDQNKIESPAPAPGTPETDGQCPPINFDEAPVNEGTLLLETFGFRVNGMWLVRAQVPAANRLRRPLQIGSILITDALQPPQYAEVEQHLVGERAREWVETRAALAGLVVTGYSGTPKQPGPDPCVTTALYTLQSATQLGPTQAAG
jgi:hypothetical protein